MTELLQESHHDSEAVIHSNPTAKERSETLSENLNRILSRFGDASFCPYDDCGHDDASDHTKSEAMVMRKFAPSGLEEPFQQLYSILYPCLCDRNAGNTASAILMGPRGSGKSLLVERCLAACLESPRAKFRKVSLHGICSRGEDVPSVVFEIIRQLSDMALEDSTRHLQEADGPNRKRQRTEQYLLRLRKSSFTSNLSLLESTLKVAEVDGIPVVLILDELDSFTDEGERQLLLYHLLDRVATPGSNLCLVGITSNFATLSILEKRIRSRAEGTSKIVYVRPPPSYEALLTILDGTLQGCKVRADIIALLSSNQGSDSSTKIFSCMEREFRLGKDVRWFRRVLGCALSLYRFDHAIVEKQEGQDKSPCTTVQAPPFTPQYIQDALEAMGASIDDDGDDNQYQSQKDVCIMGGIAVNPRLQALLDLSTPQVALLLGARRILERDARQVAKDEDVAPLTLQRIFQELESYYRGRASHFDANAAALQLLERGLLAPSSDHSGGGPLQYQSSNTYKNMDPMTLSRLPLHLPFEIDRELAVVLQRNLLECPTALREWGRKSN